MTVWVNRFANAGDAAILAVGNTIDRVNSYAHGCPIVLPVLMSMYPIQRNELDKGLDITYSTYLKIYASDSLYIHFLYYIAYHAVEMEIVGFHFDRYAQILFSMHTLSPLEILAGCPVSIWFSEKNWTEGLGFTYST